MHSNVYQPDRRNGFDKYGASIFDWSDQKRLANAVVRAASRGATVLVSNAYNGDVSKIFPATYKFKLCKLKNIGNRANNHLIHHEYRLFGNFRYSYLSD